MTRTLALTWQLTEIHGWGLVGVHIALRCAEQNLPLLLLEEPKLSTLRPENQAKLAPLMDGYRQIAAIAAKREPQLLHLGDCTILHALGSRFEVDAPSLRFRADRNIGVIAFEDTLFDAPLIARAQRYERIVVHSSYNRDLLIDAGFTNIDCVLQGVDPDELPILPARGAFEDRFVIFSGGKLEFRKGQDLVLAAFSIFHARHPDSVLVTAWHNPWPQLAGSIAESRLTPAPAEIDRTTGRLKIVDWAIAHRAPADAFIDLGFLSRDQIAPVLAECHAAIFPNRCEGATNLVAMEAMACGVPTILSDNTGHRDLLGSGGALPITRQYPVDDPHGRRRGWGESSVEEIVAHLETLYADRESARLLGQRGQAFIRGERTWRRFAEQFVEAVGSP
ncbi:glycosyltransferase family 4 protein [Sphingomonas sp. CJ20]